MRSSARARIDLCLRRVETASQHVERLAKIMRSGSEEVDHEQATFRQGMDHEVRFVEQKRYVAGAGRAFSGRGDAKGVETGGAGGSDQEAGESVRVFQLLTGDAL